MSSREERLEEGSGRGRRGKPGPLGGRRQAPDPEWQLDPCRSPPQVAAVGNCSGATRARVRAAFMRTTAPLEKVRQARAANRERSRICRHTLPIDKPPPMGRPQRRPRTTVPQKIMKDKKNTRGQTITQSLSVIRASKRSSIYLSVYIRQVVRVFGQGTESVLGTSTSQLDRPSWEMPQLVLWHSCGRT
ncbi:hypothetical protein GBAR_LOCUS1143 [Geodia barretti]|uniref:Uncharacterized protein n=1 Tax=Geodia barretti TaxID=519541 RepID=A0AA35W4F9_GEOBA|nr:hypothetical protein GBAR_LOCUS1143 [Geodia barretti]